MSSNPNRSRSRTSIGQHHWCFVAIVVLLGLVAALVVVLVPAARQSVLVFAEVCALAVAAAALVRG